MDGWKDGWVGEWMMPGNQIYYFVVVQKTLLDGLKDGWKEGWMGGKAGLRIAYSNKKCGSKITKRLQIR